MITLITPASVRGSVLASALTLNKKKKKEKKIFLTSFFNPVQREKCTDPRERNFREVINHNSTV